MANQRGPEGAVADVPRHIILHVPIKILKFLQFFIKVLPSG